MRKNIIRLTEGDLHRIVKESVRRTINEIGNTPKGQKRLGALAQRYAQRNLDYDARDKNSKEAQIYDYAKKARGGDEYDMHGNNLNPLYKDYAEGACEYRDAHTDELAAQSRARRMRR